MKAKDEDPDAGKVEAMVGGPVVDTVESKTEGPACRQSGGCPRVGCSGGKGGRPSCRQGRCDGRWCRGRHSW